MYPKTICYACIIDIVVRGLNYVATSSMLALILWTDFNRNTGELPIKIKANTVILLESHSRYEVVGGTLYGVHRTHVNCTSYSIHICTM